MHPIGPNKSLQPTVQSLLRGARPVAEFVH
jgi:hypothetical protein